MAPVSKKAKVARGKARHAGKFEKEKLDDQLAEIDDAVDLSDSDEEAIDFLDACDDAANWLLLVAPLETDGDNARPMVYDGESDRTKRRNNAANLHALKAPNAAHHVLFSVRHDVNDGVSFFFALRQCTG